MPRATTRNRRPSPPVIADPPRLRADARRNLDQLLIAARDVFVEQGADAPMDEIARRAGVGIGTLYRRFPNRPPLIRAVLLDVMLRVASEARLALAEEADAFRALERYMHRALDARIAAIFPSLLASVPLEDEEMRAAQNEGAEPVQLMIERARAQGKLRPDVAFGDIGLLLIRLSRPLPGAFPRELDNSLAHRHLDLVIAGMRAIPPLGGPAMSLADLRALQKPVPTSAPRFTPPSVGT
jgi:AcrR family transcriptional regulator